MKAQSCDWMIERIDAGSRGVDVGATEYLCEQLDKKGCDITYFDFAAPRLFPKAIEDDMFNVLDHFHERSLDFITTRHTLEHALVPLFQLWAYNRLLKDDGRLFVIVPQYNTKWLWFHTHFSCLPVSSWRMLFYRAGFRVVESTTAPWHPTRKAYMENRFELAIETRRMRLEKIAPDSPMARQAEIEFEQQHSGKAIAAERKLSAKRVRDIKRKLRFWEPTNWPIYINAVKRKFN
jgi:SAM-dependent methyltransferase